MIDFSLTEEQLALREMLQKFTKNEILPVAAQYDREGEFAMDIVKKAYDLQIMNASVPEAYGGGGMGCIEDCILHEELSYGCSGVSTCIMTNLLAMAPVLIAGSEEQKQQFLKPICTGPEPQFVSFCLTEPEAGSDVGAVATTAVLENGRYRINGQKCFITNASYASLFVVFAGVDLGDGRKGLSAFLVPGDSEGLSIGKEEDKMGQRASNTAQVIFEDVMVPQENLLGKAGGGFKLAMKTLDHTRHAVAAEAVGVARRALEEAIRYTKERIQFGKPIAANQAIRFMIADMATQIEAARMMAWQSAWMTDRHMSQSKQSAMAKLFATDVAMRVTTDCLQLFGGYGYMREYPMEKLMRDAKILQIYEGTNQIQKVVISGNVLA